MAIDFRRLYHEEKKLRIAAASICPKETTKDEDDHDSLPASTTATTNNMQEQQSSPPPQLPHFPVWSWKPPSPLKCCDSIPKAATAKEHDEWWLFWRSPASSQSPLSAPSSTLPHRNNRTLDCLPSSINNSPHRNHPMISYQPHFLSDTSFQEALVKWLQQLPETARSHHQPKKSTNDNNNRTDNKNDNVHGKWTYLPHARRRVALFDGRWWSQAMKMMTKTTSTTINSTDPNQDTNFRNSSSSSNSGVNIDKNPGSSSSRSSTDHDDGCWFPPPLQILMNTIAAVPIFPPHYPPNHILINEYSGAQDGILPHTDGPVYYHQTVTISLGPGQVLLNFTPRGTKCNSTTKDSHATTGTNDHPNHHNDDGDNCSKPLLPFQVLLHGNGSCIVFQDDAYTRYDHSIAELPMARPDDTDTDDRSTSGVHEYAGPHCCNATEGTRVDRQPHRISITIRHKY
jgi:hypothetical protein